MLYHGFDKFGQAAEGAGNNKKLQFGLMRIVNVLPTEEAVFLEVVFKSEAEVCTSVFTLRFHFCLSKVNTKCFVFFITQYISTRICIVKNNDFTSRSKQ